jgi:opacity protein-like surface antigen
MAKKTFLLVALAVVAAAGAFAQDEAAAPASTGSQGRVLGGLFSAGVGGYITSDFGGGMEATFPGGTMTLKMPYFGGGGFLFLDATYAELSFGFAGGGGTYTYEQTGNAGNSGDFSFTALDIGLLGKYPFDLGSGLSVFPLLGINYRAVVALSQDGVSSDIAGDFSALWFKFGGGLDYAITNNIYLRGNLLYGIRIANKFENDQVDSTKGPGVDASTRLGHGLDVKVAVGYKF